MMREKTPYCRIRHGRKEQEKPVSTTLTEGDQWNTIKGKENAPIPKCSMDSNVEISDT